MLESLATDWSRVLDLYAGTGAFGVEALSRGGEWVDFVEQDPKCCAIIKENLEHTRFVGKAHVCCSPVKRALSFLSGKYGLVLLDPPYSDPSIPFILDKLTSSPLVGAESTIVIEHTNQLSLEEYYNQFCLVKNLSHGDTRVSAYQLKCGG